MTGSSDTDVVFNEVDLNHNFATIHCFLFIFESFCLFALNKHVLFEVEDILQLIHSLCLGSHLVMDFESHLNNIVPKFEKMHANWKLK